MMLQIKRWMLAAALAMVLVGSAPRAAMADEDETTVYDARIQGYDKTVQLDSGSTALTWVLLIVLTIVSVGVLFKDAKRTHLD